MPDSIASAIASAPAAPAPSAPAAPPPTPSAPPPSAPPASSAPVSAPVATPVAAPSGPQPPTPPNPSEIPDAMSWFTADAKYKQDLAKFKEENPGVEIPEIKPEAPQEAPLESQAEETPAAETKTEEKPAETQEESFSLDEEPSLTPQALNDLIKGKPERETFLNADPELKNALFKLTREHGQMAPIAKEFQSLESAQFAKKTADRFVTLQAKIQTAEDSVSMNSAIDDFAQEFAVIGSDGKPVMDADGDVEYHPDFYRFAETFIERWAKNTINDVEKQLQNPNLSEREQTRLHDQREAARIALEDIYPPENSGDPDPAEIAQLPEHLRKYHEDRLAEAKRIEAANAAAQGQQGKQAQKAQREAGTKQFFDEVGQRTFNQINTTIDKMRKSGAAIPDWMLQTNIPGTNTPVFYAEVGKAVDTLLHSDPYTRAEMARLEMLPPTPDNIKARVNFYDSILNRSNERGVSNIRGIVAKIVRGFGTDLQKQQEGRPTPATTARPEPKGGGAVQPKTMSADEAWAMAQKLNAKEIRGWENMTSSERLAANIDRRSKLLTAR